MNDDAQLYERVCSFCPKSLSGYGFQPRLRFYKVCKGSAPRGRVPLLYVHVRRTLEKTAGRWLGTCLKAVPTTYRSNPVIFRLPAGTPTSGRLSPPRHSTPVPASGDEPGPSPWDDALPCPCASRQQPRAQSAKRDRPRLRRGFPRPSLAHQARAHAKLYVRAREEPRCRPVDGFRWPWPTPDPTPWSIPAYRTSGKRGDPSASRDGCRHRSATVSGTIGSHLIF